MELSPRHPHQHQEYVMLPIVKRNHFVKVLQQEHHYARQISCQTLAPWDPLPSVWNQGLKPLQRASHRSKKGERLESYPYPSVELHHYDAMFLRLNQE